MPLNDISLKAALKSMFDDVAEGKTTDTAAEQMKTIISDYVRSATVTVTVNVTGTAAAQSGGGTGTLS